MKFHNDTKFDTKQLRRIIVASIKPILGAAIRKRLIVTAQPGRRSSNAKIVSCTTERTYGLTIEDIPSLVLKIPPDCRPIDIGRITAHAAWRIRCSLTTEQRDQQPKLRTPYAQRIEEQTASMPLEQAAKKMKKLDPHAQATEKREDACQASATWKDKMLRAAIKVQQYDKKIKYYEARIARIDKEASGKTRKRARPKAGDRTFTIARGQRNFDT
jgi:hypothetical protein